MVVVFPLTSVTLTTMSMATSRCRLNCLASLLVERIEPADSRVATRLAPAPGRLIESVPLRTSLHELLGSAAAERTETPRELRITLTLFGSLIETLRSAAPPGALDTTTLSRGRLPRKRLAEAVALGGQPSTVTGAVTAATAPLWPVKLPRAVRVGPVQRFCPAVRMPCGPPSMASVKV